MEFASFALFLLILLQYFIFDNDFIQIISIMS